MTSATIKLGELISTGYRDESWRQSQDSPRYTQSLLNTIGDLLDKGADINIVVCIHTTFEGICYRLLGSDPHVDLKFERRHFSDEWFSSVIHNTSLHMSNLSIIATPLIDAAAQDNTEAISFLYSREARVEPILGLLFAAQLPIIRLWNPFLIPVRRNLYGCIQQILRRSDPQNSMVQHWVQLAFNNVAAIKGEEQLALILLRHGTQPANEELSPWSARAIIHLAYSDQTLPAALSTSTSKFIRVVSWGNLDLCALVRRDWSYQTARGPQGITSLIVAVGNASAEVCAFLLDCGANPNDHDEFGMTALMDAIYCGHEEAVNLLLARGATTKRGTNVPMKTPDPGSHPREYSEWRTTEWRTKNAIMCNAMGWDALHLAAYKGRLKALRALCNAGADVAARDNDGYSPLDIAMRHSQDESAHYLLNCKSPFDVRSPAASRLLTQAVMDCRYDIASKLVEANVLPSPGSRLGAGHTELDRMRKLKKRSMSLLPQSMLETGPLTDYDHPTFDLCVDCSTSLENAISRPPSQSDPKCMFCQLLIDCGRYSTNLLPEIRFNVKDGTDDELVTVFFGLTFRHPIKKVQDDWHTNFGRLKGCHDDNTSSPAAMMTANLWLQRCIDGHSQCSYSRTAQYFPTRVLDLGGVHTGHRPRLLQNAALDEPYLALSHRWGLEGLPVTTLDNLAGRLRGMDLAELSQIMRDAIQIVLALGYRYLWIDALCIIQDSADDWLSEASKMSSVFSGAVVTIAVADAENQSEGIFRTRPARCIRPFYVPWLKAIAYRNRMHIDGEAKYYVFPKTDLVGGGTRTKGTLDTRGWVLQEQLLSTRILYYDKGEIYWDCITVSASESSPISASLLEVTNPDEIWALKLIRRTLAGSLNDSTLRSRISDAWLEIIKNYSARVLTKQSDRLIALKGVIEPLKAILHEDQVAGMWRENLWVQLTWWTCASENTTNGFPAPSWSWLSVQERVYYHNSLLGERPEIDAPALKFTDLRPFYFVVDNVESEQLPGNAGIIGAMSVTAKCFPYRLTDKDMKKLLHKRWNRSALKLNTGRWMLDAAQELPLDIHCLIVAEDTVAKMLVCLCIVPDKEQIGMWRRIGLCHWDGLAWQIPSFVGAEPEIRTLTIV